MADALSIDENLIDVKFEQKGLDTVVKYVIDGVHLLTDPVLKSLKDSLEADEDTKPYFTDCNLF